MKLDKNDASFARRLPRVIRDHQNMLADVVRNKLLYKAMKNCISETTRFIDIGAGAGVWAIVAAKLGARRVVAVEVEESLIPIIHKHAQENGVAGSIEIIHGDSDQISIEGEFDFVLSELFGNDVYSKKVINSFVRIRERFLAPDGVLVPRKMEKYGVPVRIENAVKDSPAGLPVKSEFLRSLRLNFPSSLSLAERCGLEFLAEPKILMEVDFTKIVEPPSLKNLSASWKLEDVSKANAFAIFDHSFFTDKLILNGFDSRSWQTGVYEFQPVALKSGEINISISLGSKDLRWGIGFPSHPEIPSQNYSPDFAVTGLQMANDATPGLKYKNADSA